MSEKKTEILKRTKTDLFCKENGYILATAFIAGLVAHGYMMFAKHPNYDDFIAMFHYGSGYASGRWFLALLGNLLFRICGLYSLPWLNGLIFLALMSCSAVLFIRPFKIKSRLLACLIAALFVTFPSMATTLSYMFTAPYYALAVLFVALAFYMCVNYRYGFIPGAVLVCLSAGIYQAYFCLLAVFILYYFLCLLFRNKELKKDYILKAIASLIMLAVGIVCYIIISKVTINFKGTELSGYQNISGMGSYSISSILAAVKNSYVSFVNSMGKGVLQLFPYKIEKVVIIALWLIFAVSFIYMVICVRKNIGACILSIVLAALIPLATGLIFVMCAESMDTVHMLMCQGYFMMYAGPLLILGTAIDLNGNATKIQFSRISLTLAVLLSALVVCLNIHFSNVIYFSYEIRYEQMFSFFQEMKDRIRQTPGYDDDMPLVFAGIYDKDSSMWEFSLADDTAGTYKIPYLINYTDMRSTIFREYFGYTYNEQPAATINETEEFKDMKTYPDDGSIAIIDGNIVIKFSEE